MDKEKLPTEKTEYIVSFSGGKDSTAMLLMLLDKGYPVDKIVYVDTTKEFPEMYEHINKVEKYIGREIIRETINFDYWFADRIKKKGKHKGQRGYGFPGPRFRWCTRLKINAIHKYCPKSSIQYIGIAKDEQHRAKFEDSTKVYPLIEWGITEKDALEYCYSKGFDWGGLYEKFNRVSCWLCPLQRIGELKILYNDYPNLWKELLEMDKISRRSFKINYTLESLDKRFNEERKNES